jgi:hypothetical protein
LRYITEVSGGQWNVAVYPPGDTGRCDHIAITVRHLMAAELVARFLAATFAAGARSQTPDRDVTDQLADSLGFLLVPYGGGSDRGLRAEIAAAYKAGWTSTHEQKATA